MGPVDVPLDSLLVVWSDGASASAVGLGRSGRLHVVRRVPSGDIRESAMAWSVQSLGVTGRAHLTYASSRDAGIAEAERIETILG